MAFTTRTDHLRRFASGSASWLPALGFSTGGTTTATASMGHFTMNFHPNSIGTTFPGTLVSIAKPISSSNVFTNFYMQTGNSQDYYYVGYAYQVGTLNLAATGDQFTHDAATFPVLRTNLRGTNQPLGLIPMLLVTTATTTTAPQIILKTNAGGAGYVDEEGNSIIGTKTHVFPAAATAVQSFYCLRPEGGDQNVRDITAIEVTTAAAAGAASIFLFEPLHLSNSLNSGFAGTIQDGFFGGINSGHMKPATATAGTVTSYLCIVNLTALNASVQMFLTGVVNS